MIALPLPDTGGLQKVVAAKCPSVGVAELSFQGDRYNTCTVIGGDGNYCHIEEGGRVLNTTGGWYFSIGIQLPRRIEPGLTVDLSSVSLSPECKIKKMVPGETTVIQFGNPTAWELASNGDDVVGTLTIESITADTVTVLLEASIPLAGFDPRDVPRTLEINRSFQLQRVSPKDPLSDLPKQHRITRK